MSEYGITSTGFVKRGEDGWLEQLIAKAKTPDFFGDDDLVYTPTNPLYRVIVLMANSLGEADDILEATYYSSDMTTNNGQDLNRMAGISLVERKEDETTGKIEDDPTFRNRYFSDVSSEGFSVPTLQSKMSKATGVSFARVEENNTDTVDANGIPAHGIHVILEKDDGTSQEDFEKDIFDVFKVWKTQGVNMLGDLTVTGLDDEGISRTYKYQLPTEIDIYVQYNITLNTGVDTAEWLEEYEAGIKKACVGIVGGTFDGEVIVGQEPGDSIEAYELTEPVEGIDDVVGKITVLVGKTSYPTDDRVFINYFEKSQTDENKISVTATNLS